MDDMKILFISNDETQFETFSSIVSVQRLPYEITFEQDIQRAKELFHTNPDAVVANYWLHGGTVLDILPSIPLLTPSIVMAEQGSEEHIHQVVHAGATDFIVKDPENRYLNLLPIIIRKSLRYRDIQETQEDIIRVSENRFENLVQAIPDIVYKLDPRGYFTFINNSVSTLGYKPEELVGKHFSEILREEDIENVSRHEILKEYRGQNTGVEKAPKLFDERRCGSRMTRSLEIAIIKKKSEPEKNIPKEDMIGSIIAYGEVSATGQYKGDKERKYFTGTVGIIRDITNRRRSADMVHKLYQAVDQVPLSVLIFNKEGKLEYANPFFIHNNRYNPGDIIGQSVSIFKSPSISMSMYEEIKEALYSGNGWIGELACKNASGEDNWGYAHISPVLDSELQVTHFIVISEDITDKDSQRPETRESNKE